MKNKKIITYLLVTVLFFSIGGFKIYAGEVYTAITNGYYSNPKTGEIEDPGNNPGIGEGMVDNVVGGYSLIEKDDDGRLYATVRYSLRDQVENVKMWVEGSNPSTFIPVAIEETQNHGETGDFRFEIPSTDCVVRSSFFVGPMGRDVIFFLDFSSLEEGNTDFKVMVNTDTPKQEETDSSTDDSSSEDSTTEDSSTNEKSETESKKNESKKTESKEKTTPKETPKKEPAKKAPKVISNNTQVTPSNNGEIQTSKGDRISQADLGYEHGLLTNRDFANQNTLFDPSSNEDNKPWGIFTRVLFTIVIVLISILLALFLIGAMAIAIYYKYVKAKNIEMEKILEDKDA